ncbi:MFS general substrate transporter [Russula brevipes]|nr:MFS general substrate transporter [Russula brevipes]
MSHTGPGDHVSEETPLLQTNDLPPQEPTPLPTSQISIVFLERLSEIITRSSINPYISQLISELPIVDGDARRVGYYTGIIMSLYFAAEAVTVLPWNRLSDNIGRKPVLLTGLLGTTVSITVFGLSRSFWTLALCRCLNGVLNGNVGVSKSIIAELTDESNVARGFSLLPLVAGIGQIIGPFIGGFLSRPQDRWPGLFSHPFWSEYPYFLPCSVAAAFSFLQFIIVAVYLKETVDRDPSSAFRHRAADVHQSQEASRASDVSLKENEQPLPLRSLLTRPILTSVANYAMLAILDIAALALIPLVWSTPIRLGGLGLSPMSIGLWISIYGALSAVFQYVLFPSVVAHFGTRRVIIVGVSMFALIYTLFPLENAMVRRSTSRGTGAAVWPLIVLQLLSLSISDMGFSSVFIYISSAAPNKRSLGATNGLAQTVVSIQRTVGPAAATSLFAFSLESNVLGGNFAYAVLFLLVIVGLFASVHLPRETWSHNNEDK